MLRQHYSPEPMVLGSPGTSPYGSPNLGRSPAAQHKLSCQQSSQQNFAPSFLLGESRAPQQHTTPSGGFYNNSPHNTGGGVYTNQHQTPGTLFQRPEVGSPFGAGSQLQREHHVTWSPDLVRQIPSEQPTNRGRGRNSAFVSGPPLKTSMLDSSHIDQDQQRDDASFNSSRLNQSARLAAGAGNTHGPQEISSFLTESTGRPQHSQISPAQVDPFFTQGEDFEPTTDLDPTWVTVFGFPPEQAMYILQQFSDYGTIINHEIPSKGNWMHLQYQSRLQAKKALSKNARIFADNIQVGVTLCIDKSVISRFRESKSVVSSEHPSDQYPSSPDLSAISADPARRLPPTAPAWHVTSTPAVFARNRAVEELQRGAQNRSGFSSQPPTPVTSPPANPNSSFMDRGADSSLLNTSKSGMRSLTAAYNAAGSPYSVTGTPRTPQKSDAGGIMGKAWDYMFGW